MKRAKAIVRAITCAVAMACFASDTAAPAQVVINEIHCDPLGATPALPCHLIEIWNQSAVPVNVGNWQFGFWNGDAGTVVTGSITTGDLIYGHCCFVIGDNQMPPLLGGLALPPGVGATGIYPYQSNFVWPWPPTANVGLWIKDGAGVVQDYVYLRRGTTAAPAVAPNLPPGATWVNGNIGATATGFGHLQRKTNTNHHSYLDWEQTANAVATSWGLPNTSGTATQTSLGPYIAAVQPNQPQSTLTATFGYGANIFSSCAAATVGVSFASTNVGLPFDVGVAAQGPSGPTAGMMYLITPGGQTINVDIADPSFFFANGGTANVAFPGNFTLTIGANVALTVVAQQVVVAPSFFDGYALSHTVADMFLGAQPLSSGPGGHGQAGNIGPYGQPNAVVCGVQALPFYGVSQTLAVLTTSGRLTFATGTLGSPPNAASFTPSVTIAANDGPMIGVWADLTVTSAPLTSAGTCWMQGVAPGILRFNYNQVPYTANPAVTCTFGIQFDTSTGIVQLDGLGGVGNPGGTVNQFVGISAGGLNNGGLGANNFGPASFTPGFHIGPQGHAMIYAFGQAGTLTPGISTIQFIPNATGDYDYLVF